MILEKKYVDIQGGIDNIPLCVNFMQFVRSINKNQLSYNVCFGNDLSFTLKKKAPIQRLGCDIWVHYMKV
jgi:hypothetical protein